MQPPMDHQAGVFAVRGPLARSDIPALCARLQAWVAASSGDALCEVSSFEISVVSVEALARMQLAARRLGRRLNFRDVSSELEALVELLGLATLLGETDSVLAKPRGEPEQGKQPLSVEEEADAADPLT